MPPSDPTTPLRHVDLPGTTVARRLMAEATGSFALVFAGCGAIMVDARTHQLGHLGVALAFGLVISVMIAALGHLSGAHFNPAVTAGFAIGRHFPLQLVPPYWAAQLAGATAAALVLRYSLGRIAGIGATTPHIRDPQAFLWETVMTFFLVLVILAVATDTRAAGQLAAIAIGATVGMDALVGGPLTGASMNPARSLGPVLAGGPTTGLWIYLTAPFVGAAVAVALYAFIRKPSPQPARQPSTTHQPEATRQVKSRSQAVTPQLGDRSTDDAFEVKD